MSAESVSDVSGPVAMMSGYIAGSSGMRGTSSRVTVISAALTDISNYYKHRLEVEKPPLRGDESER